jgi:hypothetical protein
MSKFCHKCGKPLKPGVKFCMFCGTKTMVPKKKTVPKKRSVPKKKTEQPQYRPKAPSYPTKRPYTEEKRTVRKTTQRRVEPKRGGFVPVEKARIESKASIKPRYGVRERSGRDSGIKEISVDKQGVFDTKLDSYIKRNGKLITNLLRRDDYSQTDAVYLLKQFKSLDKLITDKRYDKSKFKKKTIKLYNRRYATLFKVYEYLTEDSRDSKLVKMRQGWDKENHRKIEVQELIKLVSELEKQNKLINRDIGRLQDIIDPASRDVISKSRLIREYHEIVLYYDRKFEPSKENYTELVMDYSHSEVFENELLILDKIGKLIDPRGSRSDKFTTYDIYSLANQFIQERGMNAEELTLHLNELNEKDKERKEIKRAIKKEYYDYMEVMVRTNKLAIRQPTISKPQIRKVERLRNLESTYQSVYEESKDVTPLNSLNHSKSLKKLKSLSSLDELGQFNSE